MKALMRKPGGWIPSLVPLYKAAGALAVLVRGKLAAFPSVVAQRSERVGSAGLEDDGGLVRVDDAFAAVFLADHGEDDRIERIDRGEADSLQGEHSGCTSMG